MSGDRAKAALEYDIDLEIEESDEAMPQVVKEIIAIVDSSDDEGDSDDEDEGTSPPQPKRQSPRRS